jgi:hypothetical protein
MKREEFDHYLGVIHKYYGKAYPHEAIARAWPNIKEEEGKALMLACDRIILENSLHMPPIQRFIDLVKQEGAKISKAVILEREDQTAQEKREMAEAQRKAFSQDSGLGKMSMLLILPLLSGKITRKTFLEGLRHLDTKFPRAGFATEGSKMQLYYEKQGLSLDKCPGGGA